MLSKRAVLSTTSQIREWASRLAGETREPTPSRSFYVCPEEVSRLADQLAYLQDAIIGLVGQQGVGKSSALIELSRNPVYTTPNPESENRQPDRVLFKWRSQPEIYDVFLDPSNLAYPEFVVRYAHKLVEQVKRRIYPHRTKDDPLLLQYTKIEDDRMHEYTTKIEMMMRLRHVPDFDTEWVKSKLHFAESIVGNQVASKLRREAWFETIASKKFILIDTPDYSKTDKRRMDSDLNEIHWLWNKLLSEKRTTTLVVAIQKEMFHDHFFLDKMHVVQLKPLSTEQLLQAYIKQFGTFEPFTRDAIKLLAEMSRGIFRRFLRYITLTLDLWESKYQETQPTIDAALVKQAVTIEHLTRDMENELTPLFRNSSQQRTLAVKTIMLLWENKELKQSTIATQLETSPPAISRILTTLENAKYVTHRYDGKEKIIIYKELEE